MNLDEILNLTDDLEIDTAAPTEYAEANAAPTFSKEPLPDSVYVGKITSAEFDKDRTTGALRTPETPVLLLTVEVTEGPFRGKRLSFQRVYSKTYERKGVRVSGLGDLLYAINAHDVPTVAREKFMRVHQAVENQTPVRFKTITRAFDKRFFDDGGGQHMTKGTTDYKNLQNSATVKGFARFTKSADNRLVTRGPSGEEIEGRAEINTWIPSTAS